MRSSGLRLLSFAAFKEKLRPEFVFQFLFLLYVVVFHPHLSRAQDPAPVPAPAAPARAIHGVVKSGNMPIPGAGVSAVNATTKEQVNTWTDVEGAYKLAILSDGSYTVQVQMVTFAAGKQDVR